jgi:hypothetical protein
MAGGAIYIKNLDDVLKDFKTTAQAIEQGVQIGILRAGLVIERQAILNFQGTRSYEKRVSKKTGNAWLRITPPRHVGGTGPNTVTGNLKRSIHTTTRTGFGTYIAEVGASMVYARSVEQGLPQNPSVKYPYLEPAALMMIRNGTVQRVFVTAIKEKMRG